MSLCRGARHVVGAVAVTALLGTTASCGFMDSDDEPAPAAETSAVPLVFDSQFTHDGTYQSHIQLKAAPGVDFVYTLYPTKATPRTNEWYPRGDKSFSFTFQAYDLDRPLRAAFATKRLVYLSKITVTSATTTSAGSPTEQPYSLDALAPRTTFDPEPLTSRYGMLVTSPKGAFELRNQTIGTVAADTIGVTLELSATVSIETAAGSGEFVTKQVTESVPMAIFASDETTQVADIPVNAN